MKNKKIMPTRLFGYKKKAVNAYLLEMNDQNTIALNEKNDRIDDLVQENHALKARIELLEAENKSLKQELIEYYEKKNIISNAILSAEKQAEDIIKDAEAKKIEVEQETEAPKTVSRRPAIRLKHPKA